MDELSEGELDDIRAFIENEDGSYPESADLVARWDSLSPDARAPGLTAPKLTWRATVLIWSYIALGVHTKALGMGRPEPVADYP